MGMFDMDVMRPESGMRALWLLYRRGQWGLLEDFGLDRSRDGPLLDKFDAENVVGDRLTVGQARELAELSPHLAEAGIELRLAYGLRFYEKEK